MNTTTTAPAKATRAFRLTALRGFTPWAPVIERDFAGKITARHTDGVTVTFVELHPDYAAHLALGVASALPRLADGSPAFTVEEVAA